MQPSQAQMNILKLTDYMRTQELSWDIRRIIIRSIRSLKAEGVEAMGNLADKILKTFQDSKTTEEALQNIDDIISRTVTEIF